MKVIQLGASSDALCHFLGLGGFELLLDVGVRGAVRQGAGGGLELRAPALRSVDVEALDVVLVSNPRGLLALPVLTETLGFRGRVLATRLTLEFGRLLLDELADEGATGPSVVRFDGQEAETVPMFSREDVAASCAKVTVVEFSERFALAYGVNVTAYSSGCSLGASVWLLESAGERLAYVPAASGDYNRHPKELDLLPLVDCDSLLLTDLKRDRDPHASTERMVERVLGHVTRVVDRGGVCIVPTELGGVLFDLVEAIDAAFTARNQQQQQQQQQQQPVPMYLISKQAAHVAELTQMVGAEWVCQKKADKLYAGEDAFLHEALRKRGLFHPVTDLSAATAAAAFQNRAIVFVGHPSLKFGHAPELVRMLGHDSRNAVILIDPSVDPADAFGPFRDLPIEKIASPIDPRLGCGDANQFIARCCPRNLILPHEFTVAPSLASSGESDVPVASHFAQVLPLNELTVAKSKTELVTVPLKSLEPVLIEKPSKYVDGKLDPKLAQRAVLTEVSGKAAAVTTGAIDVKRNEFVLCLPPAGRSIMSIDSSTGDRSKVTGKRKLSGSSSTTAEAGAVAGLDQVAEYYRDKSTLLLGQVDEDKLANQIRSQDPQAQVYISQGQGDADVFMSIPSLNARVTLWKETGKTLIESEAEDSRALLTSLVLSQLVVVK